MSGSTFGELFRVTNFGESHGPAIGCVIDGCPPGMALVEADIQVELDEIFHENRGSVLSAQDQKRWDDLVLRQCNIEVFPPASEVYRIEQDGARWLVIIDEPSIAPSQPR